MSGTDKILTLEARLKEAQSQVYQNAVLSCLENGVGKGDKDAGEAEHRLGQGAGQADE